MAGKPQSFDLTPEERAYFGRLFQRLALPYLAGVLALVAALVLWLPRGAAGPSSGGATSPEDLIVEIDVRAEVDRRFRELAAELREKPDDGTSAKSAQDAEEALKRARKLAQKLEQALDRIQKLEARKPAAVAQEPLAALEALEERLVKLELARTPPAAAEAALAPDPLPDPAAAPAP